MSVTLFHTEQLGDWRKLLLTEHFGNMTTTEEFRIQYEERLGLENPLPVLLDLSGVKRMNSVSLGAIMWLHKELHRDTGQSIHLTGLNKLNRKILELSSFDRVLRIIEDESELPN